MECHTVVMLIRYAEGVGHFAVGAIIPQDRSVLYVDSLATEDRKEKFAATMKAFLTWAEDVTVSGLESGSGKRSHLSTS